MNRCWIMLFRNNLYHASNIADMAAKNETEEMFSMQIGKIFLSFRKENSSIPNITRSQQLNDISLVSQSKIDIIFISISFECNCSENVTPEYYVQQNYILNVPVRACMCVTWLHRSSDNVKTNTMTSNLSKLWKYYTSTITKTHQENVYMYM